MERSGRHILGLTAFFGLRFLLLLRLLLRLVLLHHEDGFLFLDALVAFLIDFIVAISDFGKGFGHVLLRKAEQKGGYGIASECVLELRKQKIPADNGFRFAIQIFNVPFRFSMIFILSLSERQYTFSLSMPTAA